MKNIKIISLIVLMFFSLSSFANNDMGDKTKKIRNKISSYFEMPDFAKAKQIKGEVVMDISINKDGKIEVNKMDGHPEFQKYVIGQLDKISFRPDEQIVGQSLLYKIVFK